MSDVTERIRKISIIIPCYNAAPYIDRCLTSIQVQTFGIDNLEIICIDDASTDNTWEHLKKWEQRFPEQILLIHLDVNGRQGAARNIGLSYASADWIAFVDADDWLEKDYFELLYAPLEHYPCDVVSCRCKIDGSNALTYFDKASRTEEEDAYYATDTPEMTKLFLRYKTLGYALCPKLIRKSLLIENELFFPEGLAYEDNYWNPLLHIYSRSSYIIGKNLYHYFMNEHSTTAAQNAEHHIDWITVQLIKWKDYAKRGLMQEYRDELEFDFFRDAISFMKTLILRHDHPSFSLFQLERELIRQQIPDYQSNPYISDFPEINRILMDALYLPLNRSEFEQLVIDVKKYYHF